MSSTAAFSALADAEKLMPTTAGGNDLRNIQRTFVRLLDKPPEALTIEDFSQACERIVPLYDVLFPSGMVNNVLKTDIIDHLKELRPAVAHSEYLCMAMNEEVSRLGRDSKAMRSGPSITHGALWLSRTLEFVCQFMTALSEPANRSTKPGTLAKGCYDNVLKPYHGFMVSNIVKLALSTAPSREKLLLAFGFPDEDAAQFELRSAARALRPFVDGIHNWLKQNDLDFPDKA